MTDNGNEESRLLNYLTTPNVLVWSAVVASCAIPGMFDPMDLMMKTVDGNTVPYNPSSTGQVYSDGSVAGDLPMQRLAELFNINTFIVSQVNPHIAPFVSVDAGEILDTKIRKRFVKACKALAGNQLRHYFRQLHVLGLLPNQLNWINNLVHQTYKGHVTVVPSPTLHDYSLLLHNVTPETYWPAFQKSYV